jgi:hypothetical protein
MSHLCRHHTASAIWAHRHDGAYYLDWPEDLVQRSHYLGSSRIGALFALKNQLEQNLSRSETLL